MNKTEIIHVRVSAETKNALSALAEKEGCTMSAVIDSLIEQAAEKRGYPFRSLRENPEELHRQT